MRTLARRGDLLEAWTALGGAALAGEVLSRREAELAVLRIAHLTASRYEWANHALAASLAGVTNEEIRAVARGDGAWSARESALLAVADDLYADDAVSAAAWEGLLAEFDEGGALQVILLIGYYRMTAGLLNALGVEPEAGRAELGQAPAAAASDGEPDSVEGEGAASAAAKPTGSGMPAAVAGEVAGRWAITLRHPAGDQHLELDLSVSDGSVAGTVTNTDLGISIPFTDGGVAGSAFTGKSSIDKPFAIDQAWHGTVSGDRVSGTCEISGMGSFPFDGMRTGAQ